MRHDNVNAFAGIPPVPALVARGGALRTFGGLALLLAVVLFVFGAYLIHDEFTNPLASQSLGLFTAAFLLASAMALLYELVQLPRSIWLSQAHAMAEPQKAAAPPRHKPPQNDSEVSPSATGADTPASQEVAAKLPEPSNLCIAKHTGPALASARVDQRRDLPYQRFYVDRVLVRA
jgi:hypothetical protein